jgi:hypothetical protein
LIGGYASAEEKSFIALALGVLPGGEEEGAVDERVAVEDVENGLAENAGDPVHLVGRVARQDEDPAVNVLKTFVFFVNDGGKIS